MQTSTAYRLKYICNSAVVRGLALTTCALAVSCLPTPEVPGRDGVPMPDGIEMATLDFDSEVVAEGFTIIAYDLASGLTSVILDDVGRVRDVTQLLSGDLLVLVDTESSIKTHARRVVKTNSTQAFAAYARNSPVAASSDDRSASLKTLLRIDARQSRSLVDRSRRRLQRRGLTMRTLWFTISYRDAGVNDGRSHEAEGLRARQPPVKPLKLWPASRAHPRY